jgi:RND superfamily putative drug exporter
MNRLHRLGLASARHPWRTIAVWVLVIVAAGAAATAWGGALRDNWDVPGARAQHGLEEVREHFPASGGSSAQVVLHDDAPLDRSTVRDVTNSLKGADHVISVTPRMSEDGDTALLYLRYDVPTTDNAIMGKLGPLEQATEQAKAAGYQVEFGGELPGTATEIKGAGELIGVLVALTLLVIAFGSVVAAGLPVATAVAGLAVGSSLVTVLAGVMDVSATAPTIATMVGLGVGIDYALLLVTRYVDRLRAGDEPVEAAARAAGTAGRSVVGAGLTVLVSLMGLKLAGLPTFDAFGYATGFSVAAVMAAALTLVPALCALSGRRLLPRKERNGAVERVARQKKEPFTARWANRVAREPIACWQLRRSACTPGRRTGATSRRAAPSARPTT